jgi:transposase
VQEATMRGDFDDQLPLFHVFEVEDRIPVDHPLRDIKRRVDRILDSLNAKFEAAYSSTGRPSVPPERLLKAMLLMALYSVRSERQLCEQIDLNLLFRWFLDLQPSEDAFDASTFSKNRQRLETHGLTQAFFDAVVAEALAKNLCSEHFSEAERQAATDMLDDLKAKHQRVPKTMGADKGYDDGEFFQELEARQIEPHIPLVREPAKLKTVRHQKRHPGIRARQRMKQRLKTEGYSLSQKCRKKIEECFGWLKSVAGMDRSRVVGRWKLRQLLEVSAAAFNLVRMRRLAPIA